VFFVRQEELHSTDCGAGLNHLKCFLSLNSPEPKPLKDAVVMQSPCLAVDNRETFSFDRFSASRAGIQRFVQRRHQAFEERLSQRKGFAAQLSELSLCRCSGC
jgi:hypothetical protein